MSAMIGGEITIGATVEPRWRKFARASLAEEFDRAHPQLLVMFAAVCRYCEDHAQPTPIVTHVERWWDKHLRLYSRQARSAEKNLAAARAVKSPHIVGDELGRPTQPGSRALDLRSHGYAQHFIDELCEFMNNAFPRQDGKPTLLFHDIGAGPHWHLQTPHDAHWAEQVK